MKLESLLEPAFKSGLAKLSSGLPMRTTFKLEGIVTEVEAVLKKFEAARQTALKKYGKLKEDGSYEVDEFLNVIFKSKKDAEAFAKEYADLVSQDVKITKLKLDEVMSTSSHIGVEELRKLKATILEA